MFQLNNEMMNAIPMIATRKFPSPTYGIVGPLGLPKSLQPSHLIPWGGAVHEKSSQKIPIVVVVVVVMCLVRPKVVAMRTSGDRAIGCPWESSAAASSSADEEEVLSTLCLFLV
jgi:hypothetical protein